MPHAASHALFACIVIVSSTLQLAALQRAEKRLSELVSAGLERLSSQQMPEASTSTGDGEGPQVRPEFAGMMRLEGESGALELFVAAPVRTERPEPEPPSERKTAYHKPPKGRVSQRGTKGGFGRGSERGGGRGRGAGKGGARVAQKTRARHAGS